MKLIEQKKTVGRAYHKAKIAVAISIITVILFSMTGCGMSNKYLEKKLTGSVWYSEPYDYGSSYRPGYERADIYTFRSNGECEVKHFKKTDSPWWYDDDYTKDWEILEDKTLCFGDKYYEYGEDWYFKGGKLIIDDKTFYKEDEWGYSDED